MKTLDFETPETLRRIELISEIVHTPSMSDRLRIVQEYEEEIKQSKE